MNMKFFRFGSAVAALALLGFIQDADAGTVSGSFTISGTVVAACSVTSAAAVNLGSSITAASLPLTGSSAIVVNCTNGAGYDIGLTPGSANSDGTGVLTNAADGSTIAYGLFQLNSYSGAFGNTVGTNTVHGTGSGVDQTTTAYVKTASSGSEAHLAVGTYTDTVTVTVTF